MDKHKEPINLSILIAWAIFLAVITSCKYDSLGCPDLQLGHFNLDSNYVNFVVYNHTDDIVYVNDIGDELVFINNNVITLDIHESYKAECNSDSANVLYSRQHKQATFRVSSDIALVYLWNTFNLNNEGGLTLCDVFHIDLRHMPDNNSRCQFNFMLNCDSTDTSLDLSRVDPYILYDTLTVNGKQYDNVYKLGTCETEILFTRGVGIIKFVFPNGTEWYFDRVD